MLRAGLAALLLLGLGLVQVALIMGLVQLLPSAPSGQRWLAIGAMLLEALIVVPVWVWGPGKHGGGWRSLGLRGFDARSLWRVALALVLVMVINAGWALASRELDLQGQGDVLAMFGSGLGGLVLALILGAGIVPFAEELFFRGFLYPGLRTKWGVVAAALVSSLLFAGAHILPSVLLPIFLMSLLLTWVRERSGSLWPSVLLHSAINGLAFLAAFANQLLQQGVAHL
jgi:hypothetical protein